MFFRHVSPKLDSLFLLSKNNYLQPIITRRCFAQATKEAKPLPSTVKGFLARPGHEVSELLSALSPDELSIKVGPEFNDDVLIYHKLISNTDVPNLTLKLIRQFENKMLGISREQLENRLILNDTFNAFLSRKQYVKYFLLLRRIDVLKNRIVPLNMILHHYITDLKDLDGSRRIYLKFSKLGQLPNDATMTILFKAYNIQFSSKSKFAVSLDSRNETFYKKLIMKLVFEKKSFCREMKDYETVMKNAFRFSCYRLPLQFSLQLLEKLNRSTDSDSKRENLLYLDSVNMFWRGMGIKSLYYNRFDRATQADLYRQANESGAPTVSTGVHSDGVASSGVDSDGVVSDGIEPSGIDAAGTESSGIDAAGTESSGIDAEFEEPDATLFGDIDEKTGSFTVSESAPSVPKHVSKVHPDYSLILNFAKFRDFLDLFVAKQKRVSEMGLHEIITMLNSRANVVTNRPEETVYFQNLVLNLIDRHFKPLSENFDSLIKSKINKTIPFTWQLESLKGNGSDSKYLMNSHTFEQLIKLSAELKERELYTELYSVLTSDEKPLKKLQQDYNFAKWLLLLHKFYHGKRLNEVRREKLEEMLPLVAKDINSMVKFYHMTVPKWFNDQCLEGNMNKEDLSVELQKITGVFIKFVSQHGLSLSKEELVVMSKTAFRDYVRRYHM